MPADDYDSRGGSQGELKPDRKQIGGIDCQHRERRAGDGADAVVLHAAGLGEHGNRTHYERANGRGRKSAHSRIKAQGGKHERNTDNIFRPASFAERGK